MAPLLQNLFAVCVGTARLSALTSGRILRCCADFSMSNLQLLHINRFELVGVRSRVRLVNCYRPRCDCGAFPTSLKFPQGTPRLRFRLPLHPTNTKFGRLNTYIVDTITRFVVISTFMQLIPL